MLAEKTKTRMQPFEIPGSVCIPANWIATTKGDAAAEEECLAAEASSSESYGTGTWIIESSGWRD